MLQIHVSAGRLAGRIGLLMVGSLCLLMAGTACGIKRTVTVPVTPTILNARTASMEDLIELVRRRSEAIRSLSTSSLRITFTTGRSDSGRLQAYRSASGYLLLKRPDMIRLNIQTPLTKTTALELVSEADAFSLWIPSENKCYEGHNSTREFDLKEGPAFSARPIQIFEAIMPLPLETGSPDARVALKEDRDSENKYYVLSLYRERDGKRLVPVRDVWVERSGFRVARQLFYSESGSVSSKILYSSWDESGEKAMPLRILIDRQDDGYSLDLQVRNWSINPDLGADTFAFHPPPGAERVTLKEKSASDNR